MADYQTKKRIIIAGLSVLLLADGALFYFNSKLFSPASERQQTLAADTRQLALVRADVERASKIRATIPDMLKKFDDFEQTLQPASQGYSVITQELDEYARDTHLLVEGEQMHPKDVSGRKLTEISIDASVSGDYNGIVNFLNRLQRSKNVYIVDALAVDSTESTKGASGILRISLRMRTYFRKA
jgi:Tfp pilus assembly protein PilO